MYRRGSSEEVDQQRGALGRRRRILGMVILGAIAISCAGMATATVVKSPADVAAGTKPPMPDVLTASVTRQVLSQTVVLRGTVTSSQSVDVAPIGDGGTKPIVTKVPVRVGDPVGAGQVILEVAGRPVFVLQGALPIYRDLKPGSKGQDVKQLQEALTQLGFSSAGTSGVFDAGTKAAVNAFYAKIGYDPLPAVQDGDTQVSAAKDAVTAGQQALQDAQDALTNALSAPMAPLASASPVPSITPVPGVGSASPAAKSSGDTARKQLDRATQNLAALKKKLADIEALMGPEIPASEVVYLGSFPARVDAIAEKVGDSVSGKVMTLSAGSLAVTGTLGVSDKDLVHAGQKVEILSELTGQKTTGTVTTVSDSATSTAAQQQGAGGQPATADGSAGVVMPSR